MTRGPVDAIRGGSLVVVAALLLLASGCSGGAPTTTPPTSTGASTGGSELRAPTAAEAGCLGTAGLIEKVRLRLQRFMSAKHGTVSVNYVHVAGAELASRQDAFEADLAHRGPFLGGDACLQRAAAAEALVGTKLGPSPEIRIAALWYGTLIEFYPGSRFLDEAREYMLAQGYAVPSPGAGLARAR